VADPKSVHGEWPVQKRNSRGKPEKKAGDRSSLVADSDNARRRGAAEQGSSRDRRPSLHGEDGEAVADTNRSGQCEQRGAEPVQKEQSAPECTGSRNRPEEWWEVEPSVGRVVDGLPNRVSQLRALGNSIVPQIAERIGYAIGTAHEQ
jgi:DNA (cytosine-5)-methyltransferase 1